MFSERRMSLTRVFRSGGGETRSLAPTSARPGSTGDHCRTRSSVGPSGKIVSANPVRARWLHLAGGLPDSCTVADSSQRKHIRADAYEGLPVIASVSSGESNRARCATSLLTNLINLPHGAGQYG